MSSTDRHLGLSGVEEAFAAVGGNGGIGKVFGTTAAVVTATVAAETA